ncbi:hypothetical protein [Kutzneria buriramensis]|uniref:hypothetical protein n=1 Tax=Kutzneria buriramensis TaxID=1045776 RepID=UPI0011C0CA16|nr:hypothetical protein [Kutzneria buriramensis]
MAVVIVSAVLALAGAGTASAAYHGPWQSVAWANDGTTPDVVGDCNQNDGGVVPHYCHYHEVQTYDQLGGVHQVGNLLSNCGSNATLTQTITQTYTTISSYSYSRTSEFSTNVGLQMEEGFTGGVSASMSKTQTWTVGTMVSTASSIAITVPAHSRGALYFQPRIHVSQGWLEVNYWERNHGHYFWYYPGQGTTGVTVKVPIQNSDHTFSGIFSTRSTPC